MSKKGKKKGKKKKEDFVGLHMHSDMSQLDGAGKISEYVETAAQRGAPAIAFTEHGTMRGYHAVHVACEEHGIKAIHGVEFYVSNDMMRKGLTDAEKADITDGLKSTERKAAIREYETAHGIRDRWHLTVWAKNNVGLKNLFKLTSASYLDGFYYKPRIDLPKLLELGDGLIVATGCQSSVVYDRVLAGKRKAAFAAAELLRDRFGEDLWLEVQPHPMTDQVMANKFALELKERWGRHARLLATQDAHYVRSSDAIHHEALLCIGTNDVMSNPERFCFDNPEFFFKTRKEMRQSFRKHHSYMTKLQIKESLDNTILLAEMADAQVHIDYHAALLPHMEVPEPYRTEWDYLKGLCFQGWLWRDMDARIKKIASDKGEKYKHMRQIYKKRVVHELNAISRQHFVSYFLMVHDIYDWARKQAIMCGPGRGSIAGSLVAFLLGLSSVDPIEHGLIFERFLNPSRVDMPDVDMDFEDGRRHEIIQYLRDKYGNDKVAQIATIGKLSGKQCIKDVSRVLEVPYVAVNEITNSIIERSSGDERASQTIEDSFKDFKVCREFNEKYPDVLMHAKRLEGLAKNLGIHAAGVVVAPEPLVEYVPLEIRKHDGKDLVVTALDMHGVSAMGLVKLDVLGLRTLTVIRNCLDAVEERHRVTIDPEADIPLDDKDVLQKFTDHDYSGIFQYDTPSADKVCAGVNFDSFEDVVAMTALNRPGTARSGLATQYVARKKNPKLVEKVAMHPKVSEITADTLGIIVYQEHVIKIFTEIAGFAPGTADSLRKSIAKKYGDETIGKERDNFINGALKKTPGMTREQASKIIDAITFFGSYGFNKSHATAYSMIAYWGQWLKCYYPIEFYWALLKNEPQRLRVQQIAKAAKNHDIELLPPNVSVSRKEFVIDPKRQAIRGSLADIKGVGPAAAQTIMENQPYSSFVDFLGRVDRRKCHKGVVLALAKAGALDDLLPNVKWFVETIEDFWKALNKLGVGHTEIDVLLADSVHMPDYADEERVLVASAVSPLAFGRHPIDAYQDFIAKNVAVSITSMGDEDFFKDNNNKAVYVAGVIVEVKYNQIGDFHTGELPSEEDRARQYWGARYANVNVEDASGVQNRIKFDIDVFDEMRPIIDAGIGTPVVVHAIVNSKFENMKANFAIDLEVYRKRLVADESLDIWERLVAGRHPAVIRKWKKTRLRERYIANAEFKKSTRGGVFCGLVTRVRTKYDKNGNEMAFIGMLGAEDYIEVICFGSYWGEAKKIFKPKRLLIAAIEKQRDRYRGMSYFYNDGGAKRLK